VPGRPGPAGFLLASVLFLVELARCHEIDAEERRTDQRQNKCGSDRPGKYR
jgi:hypothetical protein